jgi:hypothetical protein
MGPGLGHTLLIAGEDGQSWIVGRILSNGTIDRTFGDDGWADVTIPESPPMGMPGPLLGGEANSIAQSPSGTIFVGGNDGNAHCCVHAFVASLTPSGQLNRAFGVGGWAHVLPQGDYSTQLILGPEGTLEVVGDVVYGGCGGPQLTVLNSAGALVPGVGQAVESSIWRGFRLGAFMEASFFERPDGGLGAAAEAYSPCNGGPGPLQKLGELIGLLPNGRPDPTFGTDGYTTSPPVVVDANSVWAIPIANKGVDVLAEVANYKAPFVPTRIEIRSYTLDGKLNEAGGQQDLTTFDLGRASHMAQYPIVDATSGPGETIDLLVGSNHGVLFTRLVG